jgi:outer membrane protein TolC
LINNELIAKSLCTQFEENLYQSATLTLSIPIFNKGSVFSEVELSKINLEKSILQQESIILDFQQRMDQLINELNVIQKRLESSQMTLKSTKKLFDLAQIRCDEGTLSFSEYLEIRNKYLEIQIKYDSIKLEQLFKQKILTYYLE